MLVMGASVSAWESVIWVSVSASVWASESVMLASAWESAMWAWVSASTFV